MRGAAQEKLKQGDWAGYGKEMAALGDVLARLRQARKTEQAAPALGGGALR